MSSLSSSPVAGSLASPRTRALSSGLIVTVTSWPTLNVSRKGGAAVAGSAFLARASLTRPSASVTIGCRTNKGI